jgi:hypothetical protein
MGFHLKANAYYEDDKYCRCNSRDFPPCKPPSPIDTIPHMILVPEFEPPNSPDFAYKLIESRHDACELELRHQT